MLQMDTPQDFVFGTGETHSVREFMEAAFGYAGLDWREHVKMDPRYLRPTEVDLLQADPSHVKRQFGWEAHVRFTDLVRIMVDAELEAAGLPSPGEGKRAIEGACFGWLRRP
jgi:GDPmannose 4,6-dehydratase